MTENTSPKRESRLLSAKCVGSYLGALPKGQTRRFVRGTCSIYVPLLQVPLATSPSGRRKNFGAERTLYALCGYQKSHGVSDHRTSSASDSAVGLIIAAAVGPGIA